MKWIFPLDGSFWSMWRKDLNMLTLPEWEEQEMNTLAKDNNGTDMIFGEYLTSVKYWKRWVMSSTDHSGRRFVMMECHLMKTTIWERIMGILTHINTGLESVLQWRKKGHSGDFTEHSGWFLPAHQKYRSPFQHRDDTEATDGLVVHLLISQWKQRN